MRVDSFQTRAMRRRTCRDLSCKWAFNPGRCKSGKCDCGRRRTFAGGMLDSAHGQREGRQSVCACGQCVIACARCLCAAACAYPLTVFSLSRAALKSNETQGRKVTDFSEFPSLGIKAGTSAHKPTEPPAALGCSFERRQSNVGNRLSVSRASLYWRGRLSLRVRTRCQLKLLVPMLSQRRLVVVCNKLMRFVPRGEHLPGTYCMY